MKGVRNLLNYEMNYNEERDVDDFGNVIVELPPSIRAKLQKGPSSHNTTNEEGDEKEEDDDEFDIDITTVDGDNDLQARCMDGSSSSSFSVPHAVSSSSFSSSSSSPSLPVIPSHGFEVDPVCVRVIYEIIRPRGGVQFSHSHAPKQHNDTISDLHCHTRQTHQMFTCGAKDDFPQWFPCLKLYGPTDRCTFDLDITVPCNYTAVASGELVMREDFTRPGPSETRCLETDDWNDNQSRNRIQSGIRANGRTENIRTQNNGNNDANKYNDNGHISRSTTAEGALVQPPNHGHTHRRFCYHLPVPVPALAVGLAIASFQQFKDPHAEHATHYHLPLSSTSSYCSSSSVKTPRRNMKKQENNRKRKRGETNVDHNGGRSGAGGSAAYDNESEKYARDRIVHTAGGSNLQLVFKTIRDFLKSPYPFSQYHAVYVTDEYR